MPRPGQYNTYQNKEWLSDKLRKGWSLQEIAEEVEKRQGRPITKQAIYYWVRKFGIQNIKADELYDELYGGRLNLKPCYDPQWLKEMYEKIGSYRKLMEYIKEEMGETIGYSTIRRMIISATAANEREPEGTYLPPPPEISQKLIKRRFSAYPKGVRTTDQEVRKAHPDGIKTKE